MIGQDKLAHAVAAVPASEAPETLISLESQSCDELRAIAGRGIHGGDFYFAAVAELERRAHDLEVALEAEQEETIAHRQGQMWLMAVLVMAVSAAVIARVLGL
jgi:NAD(P)H-hydrate repair Nnr-like enzyme with NAD(P)H-hydrate epimerase domain